MEENDELIAYRLTNLEKITFDMSIAVRSMADSLAILATLEVKHDQTRESLGRCFAEIKINKTEQAVINNDFEARTKCMEVEMPILKMARGWVIASVTGVFSLIGVAVVALVIK